MFQTLDKISVSRTLFCNLKIQYILLPVVKTNTVVNVWTVMIKVLNTAVTYPTMLCAQGSHQSTRVAQVL